MSKVAKYVYVSFLLAFSALNAVAVTPIEGFIARMKTTNQFVAVADIWQTDNNFDQTAMLKYVEEGQPLTINYDNLAKLMKQKNTAISLTVPGVNGGSYTLELGRYDYFTNDFEVHAQGLLGWERKVNYVPGLYYSGIVKGYPGSLVAFSFFDGEVYGIFSIPDVGNFVLVPNTQAHDTEEYNPNYLLYNDRMLKSTLQAPGCATDDLPIEFGEANSFTANKTTTFLNNKVYNNCTYLKVYEVADYDTYVSKGMNITTVTNFMTALFNNQATIYRNEGVPIVLRYLQINDAPDEYTGMTSTESIRYLKKFGGVTKNIMHGCDLALLASTHAGNMGGVAWVKAVCRAYRSSDSSGSYGFANINTGVTNFPTYSWNVEVLSHEMGHMVGSPHTHRCCWNPPARNTAIDGCTTLEGTCAMPSPVTPAGGGTIMSYCHLVSSVGINFSKGFGPQPGDTIRRYIRQRFAATSSVFPTCGEDYTPTIVLSQSNKKLIANRECTDITATDTITYFWYDKNTAAQDDDTLVMMLRKHGTFIGGLDSAGFSVETGTSNKYGSGKADTMAFPPGTATASPIGLAMRRYWKITSTVTPTSPITVMFPFTAQDTVDIDGSVPGAAPMTNMKMYTVATPGNPNPAADSVYFTTAANVKVYTKGTSPSTTEWSLSTIGSTMLASMNMTNLSVGGSGFYNSTLVAVNDINGNTGEIRIFPNPTNSAWYVSASGSSSEDLEMRLYSADGRLMLTQTLQHATANMVDASALPAGMYFYRIIGGSEVYTGTLSKQ